VTAPELDVDPWQGHEPEVDVSGERLAVSETLVSLANGYVGMPGHPRRGSAGSRRSPVRHRRRPAIADCRCPTDR